VNVPPTPDDNPATEAEAILGIREFYDELASPTVQLDEGLSLQRRVDAISLDYLTAYTLGPYLSGDFSRGPVDRPWRIRAVGNQVYSSRLNEARTDFDPEVLLFNFAGPPPIEIDAAFDQAAHILVCMERATGLSDASEIWIYYYDPFALAYTLTNFGSGRTPRALLDDAVDSNNADILVFYLRDDVGMCWRQQRDRYVTQYVVPDSIPVVDGGVGVLPDPISLHYLGFEHPNVDGSVGSTYLEGFAGGVRILAYAQGIYPFLANSGTHFQKQFVKAGEAPYPQGYIDISFDKPVSGVEIEAVGALYDNAVMIAYARNWGEEVGRVYFPHSSVGEPRPRRGIWRPTAEISYVALLPSATDVTSWDNLKIRVTPPVLPPANDPLLPDLPFASIEDVYKSTDNRVHILLSVHDELTGTYRFYTKATVIYPLKTDIDSWKMIHALPVGDYLVKVLKYVVLPGGLDPLGNPPEGFTDIDAWKMTHTNPQSGTMVVVLYLHTLYDVDSWLMGTAVPQLGSLVPVSGVNVIAHTLYDIDAWKMTHTIPQSGVITLVVITHTLFDIDSWKMISAIPVGGSLT
jgi:hypothetical protein